MTSQYETLRQSVNQLIQSSCLDIGGAYFVIKDIMNQLEKIYYAQLNKEALENAQNQINKESEEHTEKADA